ncbi:hypothetical protein L3Q67_38265 [Saccharothrix sp. AJ9571]|nr:hypothetical protein L3Q67_38265 [Saccharothrix sp. AJ9571]
MGEAEQANRAVRDAVAHARDRLHAQINSHHRAGLAQSERIEADQRMLQDVLDVLNASSPPVPRSIAELTSRFAQSDKADPLRKAANLLDRAHQALGEQDNRQAMWTAYDAIERALSRLREAEKEHPLSFKPGKLEERRNALQRALKGVMHELDNSVKPVLDRWAETSALHPAGNASIALDKFREAFVIAAESDTGSANQGVLWELTGAQHRLKRYLNWTEPEPGDDDYEEEPSGRVGSRPPGPRFVGDSDDSSQHRRQTSTSASEAPAASKPADVEVPPETTPGPYGDVRESWFRRLSRRGRPRG